MILDLSRIVIWLIVSVFIFFKIRSSRIVRKKLAYFLAIALCFFLVTISGMYPIENLFVDFKSPESVFNYANYGKVSDIIYGEESCMVIYTQNDVSGQYIIPKTEEGYKIPNYFATKKVSSKFDKNGTFDVYNISGTRDYYIVGMILSNASEQNIVDSQNRPVEKIVVDNMGDAETKSVTIYSCVENFNSDYYLIINGVKTTIAE